MTFDQLIGRLRREATANPKKAAILALALGVAAYFWAPLIWGWLPRKMEAAESEATDPLAGRDATLPVAGAVPTAATAPARRWSWNQLVAWMAADERMKAIGPASSERDPFRGAGRKRGSGFEEDEAPEATPESLGLTLTSTVVGTQSRAVIGGRPVKLGEIVEYEAGGRTYRFELIEVHPRRVVLQRAGIHYPLKLAGPDPSRIELVDRNQ